MFNNVFKRIKFTIEIGEFEINYLNVKVMVGNVNEQTAIRNHYDAEDYHY